MRRSKAQRVVDEMTEPVCLECGVRWEEMSRLTLAPGNKKHLGEIAREVWGEA